MCKKTKNTETVAARSTMEQIPFKRVSPKNQRSRKNLLTTALFAVFLALNIGALRAQTWNIGYPNAADVVATLSGGTLTISGTGAMQDWDDWGGSVVDRAPWCVNYATILATVIINFGVTNIGDNAFDDCSKLTSVTIPNSVTSIGDFAFGGCGFTSVVIPNSVISIGEGAFAACDNLTSVVISNSITLISRGVFADCGSLTSVTIPSAVTSIGNGAFCNCSSLTSITIPSLVATIGSEAFDGCSGLKSIDVKATKPPTIAYGTYGTFGDVPKSIPLHVPCSSETAYKAANGWKEFTNYTNCLPTAIAETTNANALHIYPNPVTDKLTIALENDTYIIYDIQISDISGRVVSVGAGFVDPITGWETSHSVNVSNLPAGVYFLKITTDKGEIVKKIVKN